MDNKALIQTIILGLLASHDVDDKRSKGKRLIGLFKASKFNEFTPVALRLNAMLALQEAIDDFIIHDNSSTRENVTNRYNFVHDLLHEDEIAA